MVNWQKIHPDFTPELQKEWESKGFSYEQCKGWVDALALLSLSKWILELDIDLDFCVWSRDNKELSAKQINDDSIGELWEEYSNYLWRNVFPDFTEELQKEWEDRGFDYYDCKKWINYGCQPHEAELADYLYCCQELELDKNIETARTEYPKWKELGFDLKTIILWKKQGSTPEQAKECLEFNLTYSYYFYYCWLKNSKQLTPEQVLGNEQRLREEFNKVSITTQRWLEQNYLDKETSKIYLNQQLEGMLDCSEYKSLYTRYY